MPPSCRAWTLYCCTIFGTFGASAFVSAQGPAADEAAGRKGNEVLNVVEDRTTILSIKPEGSPVRGGELVCELSTAPLQDKLIDQAIAVKRAEADYLNARNARQVAEVAFVEYEQGTFEQELETVQAEIALAESEKKRAESEKKRPEDRISLQQKIFILEQARTKKSVLVHYTKDKTIKELKSEVEKARSGELAKKAAYEREQASQQRLIRQLENCKVFAPNSGRLRYSRPIAGGVEVVAGQLLFRVVPDDDPEVETR
jgi:hypothetical protein